MWFWKDTQSTRDVYDDVSNGHSESSANASTGFANKQDADSRPDSPKHVSTQPEVELPGSGTRVSVISNSPAEYPDSHREDVDPRLAAVDQLLELRKTRAREQQNRVGQKQRLTRDAEMNDEHLEDNDMPILSAKQLYPSSASCRQLFDLAFYCQSPGGQFMNVYRYGTIRECGLHWQDVWWCMRTNRGRWMSDEERQWEVRKHGWEKEKLVKKRPEGCSEDVWSQRRRVLGRGIFVDEEARPGWTGPGAEADEIGQSKRNDRGSDMGASWA